MKALEVYVPFEPSDRIVTLGDYVNRGPESRSVLEWLIERKKMGGLIPLRGNHEAMMCAARESARHYDEWISSGGDATLTSYTNRNVEGSLALVPAEHWHFLEYDCRSYFETKTHFFVHANVYPDVPLDEQPDHMLYWEPFNDPPAHDSGKIMVCGHTPQRNGFPRDIGHAVCIDTGIYRGGWLTCLDIQNSTYWQANQLGETRRLSLPPASP